MEMLEERRRALLVGFESLLSEEMDDRVSSAARELGHVDTLKSCAGVAGRSDEAAYSTRCSPGLSSAAAGSLAVPWSSMPGSGVE